MRAAGRPGYSRADVGRGQVRLKQQHARNGDQHKLLRAGADARPSYWGALAAQAAAYIDERFCDPSLTASSVAAHFNYSADYLARLFNQAYHETLAAYIGEKRIAYAARLLIETRLSVNDVTAQCGYQSASYFARTFKKRFTLSPSDYRAINAPATKG